ncbi:MAG: hypothetical protein QW165_00385 [Candidatus Woesearchaeota archaeon]
MKGIYGAIAAGLIYAAGITGCVPIAKKDSKLEDKVCTAKDDYACKGNQEKTVYLREQLNNVKKDGILNPDEISTIETTVARAEELAKAVTGEDIISKAVNAEATAIAKEGKKYIADLKNSNQLEAYAIVVWQEQPGNPASSIRVFGVYENDHMKLEGKLTEHAKELGFDANKAFAKRVTKDSWGYKRETKLDTPEKQRELYDSVTWIDNPEKLAKYFPAREDGTKELSNSVDSISERRYTEGLSKGKVIRAAVLYKMNTLEPTIKEDKKESAAPSKADDSAKAEAEAKAAAEKKAAEEKAAAEKRAAAEKKAAEEKAAAEKKKKKDLNDIDTFVED